MGQCNFCSYKKIKKRYKKKEIREIDDNGWTRIYIMDMAPYPGQGKPYKIDGVPVRLAASFMAIGEDCCCDE